VGWFAAWRVFIDFSDTLAVILLPCREVNCREEVVFLSIYRCMLLSVYGWKYLQFLLLSLFQVVCNLEFWDDAMDSFVVLGSFSLSESDEAELSLDLQPGCRLWRVSLAYVECFNEESEQLETL
jgi:hypothetical protein